MVRWSIGRSGGPTSEVRGPTSEVRGQTSEVRSEPPEVREVWLRRSSPHRPNRSFFHPNLPGFHPEEVFSRAEVRAKNWEVRAVTSENWEVRALTSALTSEVTSAIWEVDNPDLRKLTLTSRS